MSSEPGTERPPLSVAIPARGGLAEAEPALDALVPAVRELGVEVVVVGGPEPPAPPPDGVRVVAMPVADLLVLRHRAILESSGEVIAIGEDHAVPRPGWSQAVLRAHAEHPEVPSVAGCLVNATDATISARANFLAFAAEWQPPLPEMPSVRPPPASAVTVKRSVVEGIAERPPGWFEADLLPALFDEGRMVADERILIDHFQDRGALWAARNAFDGARASYGYLHGVLAGPQRRHTARWTLDGLARRARRQARAAAGGRRMSARESALVTAIGVANGLGGTTGILFGPGRSADRVA